ncbi:MAG: DUF3105 domain-containing protein [Patescibacteria group bacterium]
MLARVPILVWFLLPTLIIVGVGVFFVSKSTIGKEEDSSKPAPVSKDVPGTQEFTIVSREHIASGTSGSGYNSDPPTSGPHWNGPASKGVYDKEFPDEQLIHNLEHGYILISYKPDVGDDVINKLKAIVLKNDWKIVMEPREKDDAKIVLAAWGRLLKMNDLDENTVRDFINTYRNRGPEKTTEN